MRDLYSSQVQKNIGLITYLTCIKKPTTNVSCNYSHAKYKNQKCKTTDLLQEMTCIAGK